jgi:hypothetical protein
MREVIVSIVVEPGFGERLDEVAARGPVWIADTPTNRSAAERWWRAHYPYSEYEGVTTFLVNPAASPDDWCIEVLPTVDMHYGAYDDNAPTYDTVEIWGATPTPALVRLLGTNGYTRINDHAGGFRASRDSRAA